MSLVPYVGYEDPASLRSHAMRCRKQDRAEMALRWFRGGADTLQIAKQMGLSEASVYRMITAERSRQLGLPNPCEGDDGD